MQPVVQLVVHCTNVYILRITAGSTVSCTTSFKVYSHFNFWPKVSFSQLVFATILWVKLLGVFVTLLSFKYAFSIMWTFFFSWMVKFYLNNVVCRRPLTPHILFFCSLAVFDPRVGHTMDVLSPFIPVLSCSDWLFHRESCPRQVIPTKWQTYCDHRLCDVTSPCIYSFIHQNVHWQRT